MSSLRDILTDVRVRRGVLTPAVVLEEAVIDDSPLHHRFEWDDEIAGHKYRLVQAAELIRSVTVVRQRSDGSNLRLRAFVSVRNDDTPASVYEPVEDVATDPVLREIALRDMRREWRQMQDRYAAFDEFWQLLAAMVEERAVA